MMNYLLIIVLCSLCMSCCKTRPLEISEVNKSQVSTKSIIPLWKSFQNKHTRISREHTLYVEISNPNWLMLIYDMSSSELWRELVNKVKSNKSYEYELLRVYENSNASYEDKHFQVVHAIPCIIYEARGGNLMGLFAEFYGVNFRSAKVMGILLNEDVDYSDYSGELDLVPIDAIDKSYFEFNTK